MNKLKQLWHDARVFLALVFERIAPIVPEPDQHIDALEEMERWENEGGNQ